MIQSAYLSIISGACLWGLIALFFKFLSACGFSPLQVVTLRVLVAALLMTAIILKIDPGLLKIRWRDSWLFIGTGLLSLVFFNYCLLTLSYFPRHPPDLIRLIFSGASHYRSQEQKSLSKKSPVSKKFSPKFLF